VRFGSVEKFVNQDSLAPFSSMPSLIRPFTNQQRSSTSSSHPAQLPSNRPGLLQETRIWYVQATSRLEALLANIREMINSGVEIAEEKIGQVLEILTGSAQDVKKKSKSAADL